jgi:hypothetical protein
LLAEAIATLEAGSFAAADAACANLLATDPTDIEALLLRGLAIAASGQAIPAASVLNHVAAARPAYAHPCRDLDHMLGAAELAIQVRTCLDLAPNDTRLRLMWAECLQLADDLPGAADALAALLAAEPANAAAQHRLGMVRAELGAFDAAIAHMMRAVALDPEPAPGWANLGMLLKIEGRFEESLDAYEEAVARAPCDARIRVNRVVSLLHAGRFAEAWRDHAWRFALANYPALPRERLLPSLATQPDLAGRTVLLTHEGGFGDTLQFCRYVPLLVARGAHIALAVPPVLHRLLARLPGVVEVAAPDARTPDYDWHCPMMTLPEVFGTVLSAIPARAPYITADPGLVTAWAARLPGGPGCRVGLVWAGQARPGVLGFATLNGRRSMSLAQLAPFGGVEGVQFVSLQAGPKASEALTPPPGLVLHDPMPEVTDFADTAAIVANLDLVISVDTSVVHLAGALGKPVFLLDRYDNCWRWLSGRTDNPWYRKLRIFRQARIGEWAPVVRQAAVALVEFAVGAR